MLSDGRTSEPPAPVIQVCGTLPKVFENLEGTVATSGTGSLGLPAAQDQVVARKEQGRGVWSCHRHGE